VIKCWLVARPVGYTQLLTQHYDYTELRTRSSAIAETAGVAIKSVLQQHRRAVATC